MISTRLMTIAEFASTTGIIGVLILSAIVALRHRKQPNG